MVERKSFEAKSQEMMNEAKDQASKLKEDMKVKVEQAKEKISETEQQISDYIVNHPMQSMLIAAGVGAVLGSIWTSSMRNR